MGRVNRSMQSRNHHVCKVPVEPAQSYDCNAAMDPVFERKYTVNGYKLDV